MRRGSVAILCAVLVFVVAGARAAVPDQGTIDPARPSLAWSGGPLTGASAAPDQCPLSCDEFTFRLDIPAGYWQRAPGGVVVRIEWEDPNDEFDLVVYDSEGAALASGVEFHTTSEQVLLFEPAAGTYRVLAHGFAVTGARYTGSVRLAQVRTPNVRAAPRTMRFAAPTLVDPQMWVAMPGMWAAADGSMFVTAPWGLTSTTSFVWRSMDAGRSFELLEDRVAGVSLDPRRRPCSASSGGGDTDIVVDRTGRVYQSDAEGFSVAVATSTDAGDTWGCNALASSAPEQDRPWLAPAPEADGDGPNVDAYLSYRDLAVGGLPVGEKVKPLQLHLDRTRDGGATWEAASTAAAGLVGATGPLFAARDGTIYQVFQGGSAVYLARWTRDGDTVEVKHVSTRLGNPANIWMSGDVDAAGTVYLAWADAGTFDILYSFSTDKGERWSVPKRVSPPASETAVMPWVAAGKAGDVAIAWYGTATEGNPEEVPEARWDAWVARSVRGGSPSAAFETAKLSETPTHFGSICLTGFTCDDRRLGEFFEIDIAPDGALVAVFDDNGRIQDVSDGYTPGPYVTSVRQVSGLGMSTALPLEAPEHAGDARVPGGESTGLKALDFTGTPSVSLGGESVRIRLTLADATDLSTALDAADTLLATEAQWIVIWKANDRVEYAGVRLERGGAPTFFGGDQPVGISRPEPQTHNNRIEKYASYPATFALEGRIDAVTGTISIEVPLKRYGLRPGDVLHGLQAFSMTGLGPQRTILTPNLVLDSTPSRTVRLSAPRPATPARPLPADQLPATGVSSDLLGVFFIAGAAALGLAERPGRRTRRRSDKRRA